MPNDPHAIVETGHFFRARYRIVTDRYCGFEVQAWRWWLPLWLQCWDAGPTNTFLTIERAEEFARHKAAKTRKPRKERAVVRYLGTLLEGSSK